MRFRTPTIGGRTPPTRSTRQRPSRSFWCTHSLCCSMHRMMYHRRTVTKPRPAPTRRAAGGWPSGRVFRRKVPERDRASRRGLQGERRKDRDPPTEILLRVFGGTATVATGRRGRRPSVRWTRLLRGLGWEGGSSGPQKGTQRYTERLSSKKEKA